MRRAEAQHGRMGWKATGYGRRSLPGQQGEVALAVQALNRMIRTAEPVSTRVC